MGSNFDFFLNSQFQFWKKTNENFKWAVWFKNQKLEPANTGIKHHLEVSYFPTHLPIYKTYYFLHKWTIVLDLPW